MKKITSISVKSFLTYNYQGNGKYYLNQQLSKSYGLTDFAKKFYNESYVKVIDIGNDSPRGGKLGQYVIVEFTAKFYEDYGWFLNQLVADKEAKAAHQKEIKKQIEAIGDQSDILKKLFVENPDFLNKIKNRIENFSSKNWRNWVCMKVCNKVANGKFELLTLSASEIRTISYSI
jgi:hypothetical protein